MKDLLSFTSHISWVKQTSPKPVFYQTASEDPTLFQWRHDAQLSTMMGTKGKPALRWRAATHFVSEVGWRVKGQWEVSWCSGPGSRLPIRGPAVRVPPMALISFSKKFIHKSCTLPRCNWGPVGDSNTLSDDVGAYMAAYAMA